MRLEGKIAVVTGATSGIGQAIAVRFALEGARIAAVGRDRARLESVRRVIVDRGGECLPLQANLLQLSGIEKMIGNVVSAFGRLDVLVNSAGVFELCDFLAVSEASFDRTVNLDLKALFFVSQSAARVMKSQGKGKIINIASEGGGVTGFAQGSVYCAAKGAVVSLTQALAVELAPDHINVNAISPGTVRTPMNEVVFSQHPEFLKAETEGTPSGRMGTVDDIVPAAVYLASDESDFVTGIQLVIDGGFSAQ